MKTSALVLSLFLANASAINAAPFYNEMLESTQQLEFRPFTNGDTPWYKTSPKEPEGPSYPINYKVNDFGVDQDIIGTSDSKAQAEATIGHKL
jgi:hypothetical protein